MSLCADPTDRNGRQYIEHEAGSWVRDPDSYHPDDCTGCIAFHRHRKVAESLAKVSAPKAEDDGWVRVRIEDVAQRIHDYTLADGFTCAHFNQHAWACRDWARTFLGLGK